MKTEKTGEGLLGGAAERGRRPRWWLIAKDGNGRMEVLTTGRGEGESLPVFRFEEEAEMFLRLEGLGDGWRTRESGVGELVSVLYGPCTDAKSVAFDPLPGPVADGRPGFADVGRREFLERILGEGPPA